MLNKFLGGAVALTLLGGVALAENNTNAQPQAQDQNGQNQMSQGNGDQNQGDQNQGDQYQGDQYQGGQNQDGQNQGWWGQWRHHGHGHGGMRGMMGDQGGMGGPGMGGPGKHGPDKMARAGFRMNLSNGVSLGVMCGNETMKDCIAETQPLIDAAKAAATAQPAVKTP